MPDANDDAGAAVPEERALVPVGGRVPVPLSVRTRALVLAASRALAAAGEAALPVLGRSIAVAVVAYAVERSLRASLGVAVERLLAPTERGGATRTDITEWITIERIRRR